MLSKKELGILIKQARKQKAGRSEHKYTQQMLADDVGKSQSYIGDLETGRTYPSYPLLSKIAEACDVPLSYFQTNLDEVIELQLSGCPIDLIEQVKQTVKDKDYIKLDFLNDEEKDRIKATSNESKRSFTGCFAVDPSNLFKAPILGAIRAGQPLYADENIEGYMYVDRSIARVGPNEEVFYLRVTGDSMVPKFYPGDYVLIRKQPDVDDGEVAAVLIDGEAATLKKVFHSNGHVWLHSINPAYEPFKVPVEEVAILGKAKFRVGIV